MPQKKEKKNLPPDSNSKIKQKIGLKREQTDKFYTNDNISKLCIGLFVEKVKPQKKDVIIEPSAGAGSFSIPLKEQFKHTIAYDLLPENDDVQKQDYLELDTSDIIKKYKKIHVIGNPPFGRQSTFAKKFIKKSAEYADSISFILPKSFKKDSFIKTFPLNFHLSYSQDLPENSFNVNGDTYDVPCIFQIWIKKNEDRKVPKLIDTPNFIKYVKKNDEPDVSIRRVGVYAGKINKDYEDDSEQSHYFLKIINIDVDTFIKKYKKHVNFEHDNTVGPKSLSIQELNKELEDLF
jgi:predicted RNA methylase